MLAISRDVRMSFNARVANFGIFVNSLRLNHHVLFSNLYYRYYVYSFHVQCVFTQTISINQFSI